MAETYVTLSNLKTYDTNIKTYIDSDKTVSIKGYLKKNNTHNFYNTSTPTEDTTPIFSFDIAEEMFLDQAKTIFVPHFVWSAETYVDSTNPNLDGKPVLVLAVKGETSVTYSFLNLEELLCTTYTTKNTATLTLAISDEGEISGDVNISKEENNAIFVKEDGLYVPTTAETKVSEEEDNQIQKKEDGIYVAPTDLSDYAKSDDIPDTSNFVEKEEGKGLFSGKYEDLTGTPTIPSTEGLVSETKLTEALEDYAKTEDLPNEYDDTELVNRVTSNEEAIATLNGSGEGSITKTVDDALNKFATDISNDGVVNTYKELVDYAASHSSDVAEMVANIASNTTAIEELNTKVSDIESDLDGHTVKSDVPENAVFADTIYDDTEIKQSIEDKVDKVEGKGLSTNDLTDELLEVINSDHTYAGFTPTTVTDLNSLQTAGIYSFSSRPTNSPADWDRFTVEVFTYYRYVIQRAFGIKASASSTATTSRPTYYVRIYDTMLYSWTAWNLMSGSVATDSALSSTSTNPVQNKVIYEALANKQDKVDGKGLSTNDLTDELLEIIETGDAKTIKGHTVETNVPADAKFTDTTVLTSMSGILPIANGGTGASTVVNAREALGAPPKSHAYPTNIYGAASTMNFGHVRISDNALTTPNSSYGASSSFAASLYSAQQIYARVLNLENQVLDYTLVGTVSFTITMPTNCVSTAMTISNDGGTLPFTKYGGGSSLSCYFKPTQDVTYACKFKRKHPTYEPILTQNTSIPVSTSPSYSGISFLSSSSLALPSEELADKNYEDVTFSTSYYYYAFNSSSNVNYVDRGGTLYCYIKNS